VDNNINENCLIYVIKKFLKLSLILISMFYITYKCKFSPAEMYDTQRICK